MSNVNLMRRLLESTKVEWMALGDVAEYSKTRIDFSLVNQANYVGVDNLLQNRAGKIDSNYVPTDGRLIEYSTGDILIGNIRPYLKKIWHADRDGGTNGDVLVIRPTHASLNSRYLYQVLADDNFFDYNMKHAKGAKMPRGDKTKILKYIIPIPCPENPKKSFEIQAEIVRILDIFTKRTDQLTAELTAELTARKKQYNYYSDQLMSFEEGDVEWKPLGDEFPFIRNGFVGTVTPFFTSAENGVRYLQGTNIHNGVISDNAIYYVTKEFHRKCSRTELKADDILMVQSGHVGESAVVGEKYQGSNCHALIVMSNGGKCNSKFVNYYFQSTEGKNKLNKITTGGTVKHILASKMKKFTIPVPPPSEQERIVSILDKFSAQTNSITENLSYEIELRQKQYAYYRNFLFSFPKPEEVAG